ncbi:MAG: diacylglycerol kinase family lipid kinase [Anaerolineales bacterium]|nr:diacylglycerol kinase family lipid kinase [Anaerolineales bacterium]
MADILVIYNPAAGRIPVGYFIGGVVRALNENGWRVEVAESLNGRHTTQLARMAAQENFRAVFAVGGDGTVGQAAAGLIGSETALGVLPAGTANVWAKEIGLPAFNLLRLRALLQNARLLAQVEPCAIDVGLCNGQAFMLWAGIGLDAMTVHKLEPRKRFQKYLNVTEYFATTVWNMAIWHGMNLRVCANDKEVEGHFLLAVASNIRHYVGGLAEISPTAYLNDGQMDLWLFSGSTLADAFRHFFAMRAGKHLTSDMARRVPFQTVVIESDSSFPIQLDGEPMLGATKASLQVLPRALRVLIPPKACWELCQPV